MSSSVLLLLLGVLGLGGCHPFKDASESAVHRFQTDLQHSMDTLDVELISGLFAENALFVGCITEYNKKDLVEILTSSPKTAKITTDVIYSTFINPNRDIYYTTYGPWQSMITEVLLRQKNGTYYAEFGRTLTCSAIFKNEMIA